MAWIKRFLIVSLLLFTFLTAPFSANALVRVKGYFKKNGTYVAPHVRTNPNSTITDNFSYPGNYNPNTGKITPGGSTYAPISLPSTSPAITNNLYIPPSSANSDKKYNTMATDKGIKRFIQYIPVNELKGLLVKGLTERMVYSVDANGCLRWLTNEKVAIRTHGTNWNKSINLFDDSLINSYKKCEPINE